MVRAAGMLPFVVSKLAQATRLTVARDIVSNVA
jgi:hypothetical protein